MTITRWGVGKACLTKTSCRFMRKNEKGGSETTDSMGILSSWNMALSSQVPIFWWSVTAHSHHDGGYPQPLRWWTTQIASERPAKSGGHHDCMVSTSRQAWIKWYNGIYLNYMCIYIYMNRILVNEYIYTHGYIYIYIHGYIYIYIHGYIYMDIYIYM